MSSATRQVGIPSGIFLDPTLMATGLSAAKVYSQPAAELARLTKAGVLFKVARGYYAAVPINKRNTNWRPSLETLSAGVCNAVHGPGNGALWGLSAARIHGALPRAIAIGYVSGPTQHRPIEWQSGSGTVEFRKRNMHRLDLQFLDTELGPVLVTSIDQTILDLSAQSFINAQDLRAEAVKMLMGMTSIDRLMALAIRVRGQAAFARVRKLQSDAHS